EGPVGEAREAVRGTSRASRLRVFRQDGRSRLDRTGGTDPPPIHGQVPKLVPSRDRIDEHSVVRPVDHGLSARAAILARSVLRLETGDPSDPLRSYRVRTHGRMVVRTIATGRDVHAVQTLLERGVHVVPAAEVGVSNVVLVRFVVHVLEARAGYAGKCSVCAGIVRESSLARALDGVGYEAEQLRIGGGHLQWSRGRDTGGAFVRRPAAEVVE